MAISYPVTLPSSPQFSSVTLRMCSNVAETKSIFTGSRQVFAHQGQWWEADVQYAPMTRAQAEAIISALGSLQGPYGTFYLGDPSGKLSQGGGSGCVVNGAGQTGRVLNVKTLTGVFKAGDYITVGASAQTRLYKILKDSGSGTVSLDIFPNVRDLPADGAGISTANCIGTFALADPQVQWSIDAAIRFGLSFKAVEAY